MNETDSESMDNALARFMMTPGSRAALEMVRGARSLRNKLEGSRDQELVRLVEEHHNDCMRLHDASLTLEADPEILGRNLTARVISGIFPVLNAIEEFRSFEDQTIYDMILNSLGIVAEVATASQYLEATRLSANAHSERELVKVEERLVKLSMNTEGDLDEKTAGIEDFMDEVRSLKIPHRKKPMIPFLLWILISVVSYKQLKAYLEK
jgi:hypothetical protein